jgi:eukaryotic-like serine/threonine-protein kinase
MAFNVGDTAGDYQVIGILGAGGMGQVYKARNAASDRVEAMKVLLPDLANQPELADRFTQEIKLLAGLNHPNIAAPHTAVRQGNQLLMVMEFVEGRTLEDRLKEGPLPVGEAVGYVRQALSALAYAHEHGVVHRDIKPSNLMVTAGGEVKLLDFGIAKAAADGRVTTAGTTPGSCYYMSPEQVKGSAEPDGRSDVYSMGVLLYELVTGTRPFQGDSESSIMAAHLERQPVPPIQVEPGLPAVLNEIILAAIEKDAANRFQSAKAFRAALENVPQAQVGGAGMRPALAPDPPQPAEPPAVTAAPAPAAPQPPQPAPVAAAAAAAPRRSGHRGLWMALGAVAAIAVLAVAAIQLPRWYRARAGNTAPAAPQAVAAPSAPESVPAQAPAEPAPAAAPEPTPPAASTAQPAAAPAAPGRPAAREARRSASPSRQMNQEPPPPPPVEQPPAQQAAPAAPAAPAVDTAGLEEARDRLNKLAPRANALRSTLQNLEQQQRSQGLGLRVDMATSWKRMEGALDDAEAALKAGDPGKAKSKLDQAGREADKLDKFLGH